MSDGENSPRYVRVISVTDPQCRYPSQYARPVDDNWDRADASSFQHFLKPQGNDRRENDPFGAARWSSCSDARFGSGRFSERGHCDSFVSCKMRFQSNPSGSRESVRSSSTGSMRSYEKSHSGDDDIWDAWNGERNINGSSVRPTLTLLGFRTSFLDALDADTSNSLRAESHFGTVDATRDSRLPSLQRMEENAGAVETTIDNQPSHKQSVTFADPLSPLDDDEVNVTKATDALQSRGNHGCVRRVALFNDDMSAETAAVDDVNATRKNGTSARRSPFRESRTFDDIYNCGVWETQNATSPSPRNSSSSAADVNECHDYVGGFSNSESQLPYGSRLVRVTHMDSPTKLVKPRVTLMDPRSSQSAFNDSSASTESPKSKLIAGPTHRSSVENLFDQINWDGVLEQVVSELEKDMDDSSPFINKLRNSFHRVIHRSSARPSEMPESCDDEEDQDDATQKRLSATLREACARVRKEVAGNVDEDSGEAEEGAANSTMGVLSHTNPEIKGELVSTDVSAAAALFLEQITAAVRSTLELDRKRRGSMSGCDFYKPLKDWAAEDVCYWLNTISHFSGQEVQTIVRENDITGPVLLSLTIDELKELGLRSFGLRKQLKLSCKRLVEQLTQSTGLTSGDVANITRDAAPAPAPTQTQMTVTKQVVRSVAYETKTQVVRAVPAHRSLVSCGPLAQVRLAMRKERALSPPKTLQIPQPSCIRDRGVGISPVRSVKPCLSLPRLRAPSVQPSTPSSSRDVEHPPISPRKTPAPPRFLNVPSISASASSPTLIPSSVPLSPSPRNFARSSPDSAAPQITTRPASSSNAQQTLTLNRVAHPDCTRYHSPIPSASTRARLLRTQPLCAPPMTRTMSPALMTVARQDIAAKTQSHSYTASAGTLQAPAERSSAGTLQAPGSFYHTAPFKSSNAIAPTLAAPVSERSNLLAPTRIFTTNDLKGQSSSSSLCGP